MKIRVIRAYSGAEGVGPDRDVHEHTEHTVTRARGSQLYANGLVEILDDDDADSGELRTDGPTVSEFVSAGYPAKNYPPNGYASASTADEIAAAIAEETIPMTTEDGGVKVAPEPENKQAPAPANKRGGPRQPAK